MVALIVHARRTGLGIIRMLAQKKFKIYCADFEKAPAFYSKNTLKYFIINEPKEKNYANLKLELNNIGKQISKIHDDKIYLFTGSDDYLKYFSENWNDLKNYFKPTFETNSNILKNVLSKTKVYNIAKKAGVDYPKSIYNKKNINSLNYPVIIKPEYKKTEKIDFVKLGIRAYKAKTSDELLVVCKKLEDNNSKYVIQEYIPGNDDSLYTVACYVKAGRLITGFCGKKLRQFPPSIGECSYGISIENKPLIEITKKLVFEANFTGIAQVEYKEFKGKFFLIEINPRPFSWIELFNYSGINLAFLATQNNTNPIIPNFKSNKTWMFVTADFYYNVLKNNNVSLISWINELRKVNVCAFYDKNDPKLFVYSFLLGLKNFLKI